MKIVTLLLSFLTFPAADPAATASNDDAVATAAARQAVHECLQNARQTGLAIGDSVETTGICFVSGETRRVTFFGEPKCPNAPVPCAEASALVATVDLGCENEVVSTTCNFMTK